MSARTMKTIMVVMLTMTMMTMMMMHLTPQAQRGVVSGLQAEARSREDEVRRLREMVVHLQTKVRRIV
jgi:hypothetical protein